LMMTVLSTSLTAFCWLTTASVVFWVFSERLFIALVRSAIVSASLSRSLVRAS
jgi:hypothetical protein